MKHLKIVVLLTTSLVTIPALGELHARSPKFSGGSADPAFYDTELKISWVTTPGQFGRTWDQANDTAQSATDLDYLGWRLPSMDVNQDGVVVDCAVVSTEECKDNELGFMYYHNGVSFFDSSPIEMIVTPVNGAPSSKWSSTPFDANSVWTFNFFDGTQSPFEISTNFIGVWLVKDGDLPRGRSNYPVLLKKISVPNASPLDEIGHSVHLADDVAVIGAPGGDFISIHSRDEGGVDNWGQTSAIQNPFQGSSRFGDDFIATGNGLLVGSPLYDDGLSDIGAASLYGCTDNYLTNCDSPVHLYSDAPGTSFRFGASVDIDGNTLVIGEQFSGAFEPNRGRAWIYEKDSNDDWLMQLDLLPDAPGDQFGVNTFGSDVAISGDTIAIGDAKNNEPCIDDPASICEGAVYVYERNEGGPDNWGLVQKLQAHAHPVFVYGDFGQFILLEGDVMFVMASRAFNAPRAAIYTRDTSISPMWQLEQSFTYGFDGLTIGGTETAALLGDTLVFGAPGNDTFDAGTVHIRKRDRFGINFWGLESTITHPEHKLDGQFANSVSLSNNLMLVGSPADDTAAGATGSAYLYRLPTLSDFDNDGVNDNIDNCTDVPNPDQIDVDEDFLGNACDADFNNDCNVDFLDFNLLVENFMVHSEALYDLNNDTFVNFLDVGLFASKIFMPVGPSYVSNACEFESLSFPDVTQ